MKNISACHKMTFCHGISAVSNSTQLSAAEMQLSIHTSTFVELNSELMLLGMF